MDRRFVGATLVLAVLMTGCATSRTIEATFARYDTLPNGKQAAIVYWEGGGQETAYASIDDLQPGDAVSVREIGGPDWDMPHWTPTLEIVWHADE